MPGNNSPQESRKPVHYTREAAEPTNKQTSATRATPTQPRFAQPHRSPRSAFPNAYRLLAGAHRGLHSQLATNSQSSRARWPGTTPRRRDGPSPGESRPPSPHQPPSPQSRVRTGSDVPTDAQRSPSTARLPCISAPEAPRIWHPTPIAAAESVDLHQTHQASSATVYYYSAMCRDAEGSPAPVRASPAPVQPQKPKTVSGVWSRPAGRRAQRGQRSGTHPKSPPIEARTDIPSALTTTTTTAPSQPSAERRGMHSKPSMAPASSAQGLSSARGCVWWATHQPDGTPQPNETNAPSKLPPWALACPP